MTAYGSIGWAFVLASLAVFCSARYTNRWPIMWGGGVATVAAAFTIQFDQIPAIGFVAAIQNEPSVALLLISGSYAVRRVWPERMIREAISRLCVCVFWLCLVIYPLAEMGPVDLYSVGYHPYAQLGLLFLALLFVRFETTRLLAVWVALALLGHTYGVGESDNAWDYLMDPMVFFYSSWHVLTRAWRRFSDAC